MNTSQRFVLAFAIVFVVSGFVLVAAFDAHRSDVTSYTESAVEDQAEGTAAALDDRLRGQQQTLEVAATNEALADHRSQRQHDALEGVVDQSAFDGASIVDSDGTVQSLTTGDDSESELVGADFSDRPYVQCALEGDRCISDPFVAETDNYIVVISVPLYDDGEVVGTVNAAYHLTETVFFDALSSVDERTGITITQDERILYAQNDHLGETIDRQADLETVDWTVTVHHDQQLLLETLDRLQTFQIIVALAFFGSVTGFAAWVYRSKVKRIGRLTDRLDALEERTYDTEITIGGPAEWHRIDLAMDRLGQSLARREQMLLVHNRILRHNLRNELNVIEGHAAQLEATTEGKDCEAARTIQRATTDLLELADRARTTERLLERSVTDREPIDIVGTLEESIERLHDEYPDVEVHLDAPKTASVVGGPELVVAFDELLENVGQHAGETARVDISVHTEADTVRVLIADDGPGIPAATIERISGSTEISPVNHARGIGLWLVDWTVSLYDGSLEFLTDESGTGTVVELTFERGPLEGGTNELERGK
ncbi:cache domain-containing protein [Natrialbaceae archaeon A-CW2]|uniref:sensor histidine kinase n=1 Tax=Natronosalvus amylolyticus TaxID=2961994 RepID=UPI0020C990A2|nr:sensor histidine kinase [Natronosalvus amylolyticus]